MISLSDSAELTDSRGRVKHPPDCSCKVCKGVRTAEVRRQAEAEQAATVRAVARALVQLMARGSLSGPDALRSLVGHDDSLRILRMAGMDADTVAGSWQADQPPSGPAEQKSSLWASSPDHDPRVMQAILHGTDAEVSAIRAAVAQEYKQRAAEKTARQQSSVMWRTPRDGYPEGVPVVDGTSVPAGLSPGPDGAPQQRSVVHHGVQELGQGA